MAKALMYARAGNATSTGAGLSREPRSGAIRSNFSGPKLRLVVNGTARSFSFDRDTWSVSERAGGQANELRIDLFGFTPAVGHEIVFGADRTTGRLFRGTIVRVRQVRTRLHEGRTVWACTCLDWNYQLNAVLVTAKFTSESATVIAQTLVALATGFTSTHVQPGLATLDEFQVTQVTLTSALQQLADRLGGYQYVDFDKDVHLFTSETGAAPETINTSNLHTHNLSYEDDIETVRNRIEVEGRGAAVLAAVSATSIPVDDITPFATSGTNYAKLEAQIIAYTGVAGTSGAGSAIGAIVPPPAGHSVQVVTGGAGGSLDPSAVYGYAFTWVTAAGETTPGPTASGNSGVDAQVDVLNAPTTTDPAVTSKNMYRTEGGGGVLKLESSYSPTDDGPIFDADSDATLGAVPPTVNTAGPSGLEIPAGSTSLPVADTSVFTASGWALAPGDQMFFYNGRSTTSGSGLLTGIPASGVGSLTAAVRSGTIKVVPHLTGVSGITHALKVGESINILVIREDATSQAAYGVRTMPIQDRRLSLAGAANRGDAVLALVKDPRVTGTCTSSDPKCRAARPLAIAMTADWDLATTVVIQAVTIRPAPGRPQPMRDVAFASRSIEDLFSELRAIKEQLVR